jgi:hypothetical protein
MVASSRDTVTRSDAVTCYAATGVHAGGDAGDSELARNESNQCPERKIGLIAGGEDTAGVERSDDDDDPDDACRQPNFERFATDAHGMPACHSDATAARPKENQPTRLSIPRYWSASVARPLMGRPLPASIAGRARARPDHQSTNLPLEFTFKS